MFTLIQIIAITLCRMSRSVGVIGKQEFLKNRILNVVGILSFFLIGTRVIDPALQEKGEFTEICIEFLQNVLNHNPKRTKRT